MRPEPQDAYPNLSTMPTDTDWNEYQDWLDSQESQDDADERRHEEENRRMYHAANENNVYW